MLKLRPTTLVALLAGLALLLGVTAQAIVNLEVEQENGIRYVTGGISNDEQQAIAEIGDEYSLKLTLAREDGAYLDNVQVAIYNGAGEPLISTVTNGPIMLVALSPGDYQVMASVEGIEKQESVTIGDGETQEVVLYW